MVNLSVRYIVIPWTAIIGAKAFNLTLFGEGAGIIWINNLQCIGNESHLIHCLANFSGINSCSHIEDAGVRCLSGKFG